MKQSGIISPAGTEITAGKKSLPEIDLMAPKTVETATFALG